jgi:aryl-alcohol dehydrogenase-like predicted oxidoreductase
LSGKYNDGIPPGSRATLKGYEWLAERIVDPVKLSQVRALAPVAADLGCTLAQLALAWCLKNPHVTSVITGASRPSQVEENMRSLAVVPKLSAEIIARIDAIVGAPV